MDAVNYIRLVDSFKSQNKNWAFIAKKLNARGLKTIRGSKITRQNACTLYQRAKRGHKFTLPVNDLNTFGEKLPLKKGEFLLNTDRTIVDTRPKVTVDINLLDVMWNSLPPHLKADALSVALKDAEL